MLNSRSVQILLSGVISFWFGYGLGESELEIHVIEMCTYDAALDHICPSKSKWDKCIEVRPGWFKSEWD